MLVGRYADGGLRGYGRVERGPDGDRVVPVEYDRSAARWVPRAGRVRPLREVALLPPAEPSKIVCIALNYASGGRAASGAKPPADAAASTTVVLKPPSSLAAPGDAVSHPGAGWELRHEAELAVVIGVPCKKVPAACAAEVVAGYTCANDITAYARRRPDDAAAYPIWAKHFDGFTPMGPWLATDLDPADAEITCRVDGEIRQHGSTRALITPVHEVIALVSEHMTLLPGDVVLTGTCAGSGPLPPGSRVEVTITGIGTLRNVIDPPSGSGAPAELGVAGHAVSEGGRAGDADL